MKETKVLTVTSKITDTCNEDTTPYIVKDKTYTVTFICEKLNMYGIYSNNKEEHCISMGNRNLTLLPHKCYFNPKFKKITHLYKIRQCNNCKVLDCVK